MRRKRNRSLWHVLILISFVLYGLLSSLQEGRAQTPIAAPLIQSSNLTYVGSFKVPSGTLGSTYGFGYAGTGGLGTYGVTYNAANNSLFMGGHPYEQKVAEITVPQSLSGSATATVLQNLKVPAQRQVRYLSILPIQTKRSLDPHLFTITSCISELILTTTVRQPSQNHNSSGL